MRKNAIEILCVIMASVMLTACGNTDSKVNQVIQNQMQEEDGKAVQSEETEESESSHFWESEDKAEEKDSLNALSDDIDVDLTKLSSTMVYSEVYNMMCTPENYIGKTVKMSGMFVAYSNQDGSQYYPAVIIADATACCSQGLEFILEGNPAYPEGYPKMETTITVVGVFETYEEEGNIYCRLQNAKLQ